MCSSHLEVPPCRERASAGSFPGRGFLAQVQWGGPTAVQAGGSTRTRLRLFMAGEEQGSPAGTQFWGGHCRRRSQHSLSSQDIFCTAPSMSLAPSGMASGGCWVLLNEVWSGRFGTLKYPANSLVVFPAETRSFLWHSSRLALP